MATVNERVGLTQAMVINGVDAGGAMTAIINAGFDNILRSSPDGLQVPVKDKDVQFVRGTITTQDWVEAINLLTGVVGTYVFYERKSGVAPATGYIKHTITAPVIYSVAISIIQGGYATLTFNFECRPADEAKTIADMWAMTDDQAAPTYVSAARGGFRIETCKHDPAGGSELQVYHLTRFDFTLAMPLVKACNDGDVGYTCVDARLDGLMAVGSISFRDSTIASAKLMAQQLLLASKASLELYIRQSQAAASKVITIAGVDFNNIGNSSDVNTPFTEYTSAFDVGNDTGTQLTLEGDNKIITIEDEV